ncbi:MAG: formylglycine-generating enzyme family protein [Flexilinea sp.]
MKKFLIFFFLLISIIFSCGFQSVQELERKATGFTETELIDSGRTGIVQSNGTIFYEGFYIAPNGNYFPLNENALKSKTISTLVPETNDDQISTAAQSKTADESIKSTPTIKLEIGSTQVSDKDSMVMMYVPEGDFLMGLSEDQYADAIKSCEKADISTADCENWFRGGKPQHMVWMDAYWIDKTEVTNEMYAKCIAAGICYPPQKKDYQDIRNYFYDPKYKDFPVNFVDWNMSDTYCKWTGRSLPTEAQWEKAARGTDGRTYPWGEAIDCEKTNFNQDNTAKSYCVGSNTQVGIYLENISPYGAMDMSGNVSEWVFPRRQLEMDMATIRNAHWE